MRDTYRWRRGDRPKDGVACPRLAGPGNAALTWRYFSVSLLDTRERWRGTPQRASGVISPPLPQHLHTWSSHLLQLPVPAGGGGGGRDRDPPFPEPATGLHLSQAGMPRWGAEAQRGDVPWPKLPAWLAGLETLRSRCHPRRPPSPPVGLGCTLHPAEGAPNPRRSPPLPGRPHCRLAHKLKFNFIKAAHNQSLAR